MSNDFIGLGYLSEEQYQHVVDFRKSVLEYRDKDGKKLPYSIRLYTKRCIEDKCAIMLSTIFKLRARGVPVSKELVEILKDPTTKTPLYGRYIEYFLLHPNPVIKDFKDLASRFGIHINALRAYYLYIETDKDILNREQITLNRQIELESLLDYLWDDTIGQ